MSVFYNNALIGASGVTGGYKIERSLRFNSADSAYLSRTPSAGNRKTWTWSGWVKRVAPSGGQSYLFGVFDATGNNGHLIDFLNDTISVKYASGGSFVITTATTALFRDFSAWMHVLVAFDTTQATQSNRLKIYVNGVQQALTGNSWGLSTDYLINNAQLHAIGRAGSYNGFYLNGYLGEIHFIDGQALDPTSFGELDANNIWQPKAYGGTYGTTGFKLDFADNSAATATTLGKDTGGNGNNWTPNNFSVTAGTNNDSLVDTPTNYGTDTGVGGTVRGNYCTLNPLDTNTGHSITNGNLDITSNNTAWKHTRSTFAIPTTDKWYAEFTVTAVAIGQYIIIGFAPPSLSLSAYVGAGSGSIGFQGDSTIWTNGSSAATGATFAVNDVIQIAVDRASGKAWLGKNGTWIGSGNPATGTNATTSSVATTGDLFFGVSVYAASNSVVCNWGQRPFAYTAPSGYKALCTQNLPEGSITTTGSFTGNANADGPFIWLNGVPTAMTINGNAVTFGTHVDKLANGFKLRTSSTSYNTSGSNTYSITTTGAKFKTARAQTNP